MYVCRLILTSKWKRLLLSSKKNSLITKSISVYICSYRNVCMCVCVCVCFKFQKEAQKTDNGFEQTLSTLKQKGELFVRAVCMRLHVCVINNFHSENRAKEAVTTKNQRGKENTNKLYRSLFLRRRVILTMCFFFCSRFSVQAWYR